MPDVEDLLAEAGREMQSRWSDLEVWLGSRFGREVGLESALFLIGIQSRGSGYEPQLEKEAKQDLIMEGSCVVLEMLGYYERTGVSSTGQVNWSRRRGLPPMDVAQQESLLKLGVLRYFEQFMDTP